MALGPWRHVLSGRHTQLPAEPADGSQLAPPPPLAPPAAQHRHPSHSTSLMRSPRGESRRVRPKPRSAGRSQPFLDILTGTHFIHVWFGIMPGIEPYIRASRRRRRRGPAREAYIRTDYATAVRTQLPVRAVLCVAGFVQFLASLRTVLGRAAGHCNQSS
eukprot:COSAG02_NODE_2741_length_8123_cov_5.360793_7_plen_160_part_00